MTARMSDWSRLWRGLGWNSAEHTHAKTPRIEACGGGDGGGGESTWSGAGEGDVGDADEAMVVCAVVDSTCVLVGGVVGFVCACMGVRVSMVAVHGDRE